MTPQELVGLAYLRRARDLIDREDARAVDGERVAAVSGGHLSLIHI